MATGGHSPPPPSPPSPSLPIPPVTSWTDCPQCGSLCLGNVILRCGHLTCRRCLHDMLPSLGPRDVCQQCGEDLDLPWEEGLTFPQLVQRMGMDPVMDQMVCKELEKVHDSRCLHCDNNNAVSVCLDCQENYCTACSRNHKRSRVSKDHVLRALPLSLQNTPTASHASPRPPSPPSSVLSTSGTASSDAKEQWNQWVKQEVGMLQKASQDKQDVRKTLEDVASMVHHLLDRVDQDQQVLQSYIQHLPSLHVTDSKDHDTYVITSDGGGDSGVSIDVRTTSLEDRLQHVRRCPGSPTSSAVETIKKQLSDILIYGDEGADLPGCGVVEDRPNHMFTASPPSPDDKKTPWITSMAFHVVFSLTVVLIHILYTYAYSP